MSTDATRTHPLDFRVSWEEIAPGIAARLDRIDARLDDLDRTVSALWSERNHREDLDARIERIERRLGVEEGVV